MENCRSEQKTHRVFRSDRRRLCRRGCRRRQAYRKCPNNQLFHPIGTQCVIGVQLVRAKARRKLMHLSLRLAFYIRIELDRSNVDARSFQAHPDKMLCFQGLYGFYRKHPVSLNFLKAMKTQGKPTFEVSRAIVIRLCPGSGHYARQEN